MTRRSELAWTLATYAALSGAWTWPLAADPLGLDVSRQPDGPNTLGLGAAAARASGTLFVEGLAWPAGQSLARGDSFVFFALARLLHPLHPALPVSACVLVGPVLSALGADRLARQLGATFPWTLLAGVTYGYSGLVATSILEGHGMAALNPWLPWMALSTLRACAGGARDAAAAGVAWTLCLATSAYAGISASLLLGVLVLGALLRERRLPAPVWALLGAVTAVGLAAVAMFLAAPAEARRAVPTAEVARSMMTEGSARLGTLLWRTPSVDLGLHSQAALLGSVSLALATLGAVLPRVPGSRRLLLGALGLVALSLGPAPRLFDEPPVMIGLLAPLTRLGAGAWFRFPERLLLPATLALGALAARALTQVAEHRRLGAAALLAAAFAEPLLLVGLPFRVGHHRVGAPTAYAAAPQGRAVLDVWPRILGRGADAEGRRSRRMLGWSAFHGRPILTDGLNVSSAEDRRAVVSDWLLWRARPEAATRDDDTRRTLDALGVGAVALHPDLFPPAELPAVEAGLDRLFGPTVARSVDFGDAVWLWSVADGPPPGRRADRLAAWDTIHAEAR